MIHQPSGPAPPPTATALCPETGRRRLSYERAAHLCKRMTGHTLARLRAVVAHSSAYRTVTAERDADPAQAGAKSYPEVPEVRKSAFFRGPSRSPTVSPVTERE
ncbi:hypothetical protein Ate01nite_39730 [Actinoplanes teichomyceticus]|nr:hypothetical protein Ate01nite_39730 [Actinoplanes teichomyceticus]